MQIIILGMHRSGTSLAGQLLEALGFHFGPEHLALAPKKDNPLGYWERSDVNDLNTRAFAALNVTWERVGNWSVDKLSKEFIEEFDREAAAIIAAFPADKPWFLKDPRMCLTLPLWEKHFRDPFYVFVYRDPVEISRSLWTRNRHPPKLVMALWERHLADALNQTRGKRRLLLRYDDLIRDRESTIRHFSASLEKLGVSLPVPVEEAIESLRIEDSLRHHKRRRAVQEIPFTPSQERLNHRIREGAILNEEAAVDAAAADCEILNAQKIAEFGETDLHWKEPAPSFPCEAEASTASSFLKRANAHFPKRRNEVATSLEAIHLLGKHLSAARPNDPIGYDYAVVDLINLCEKLSAWNPFHPHRRRAADALKQFKASPPRNLVKLIRNSSCKNGKHWSTSLAVAAQEAETLLGDFILGNVTLTPAELALPEETSPEEHLAQYQAALSDASDKVNSVTKAITAFNALVGELLPTLPPAAEDSTDSTPWRTWSAARKDADVEQLLEIATALSTSIPFSKSRREAIKAFAHFKATIPFTHPYDRERLNAFAPALKAAGKYLTALTEDLQKAGSELRGITG